MISMCYRKIFHYLYNRYTPIRNKRAKRVLAQKKSRGFNLEYVPNSISVSRLPELLRRANIKKSDTIFIRTSLGAAQAFEGGVQAYLDCLMGYFKDSGNIIMSSYTFNKSPIMFLAEDILFDPERSIDQLNLVSEMFRRMDNVERSIHPTHSVIAFGKDAEWITRDHHNNPECYGPNSPFARLFELGAKEISFGTNPTTINYHYVEQFLSNDAPTYRDLDSPVMCRVLIGKKEVKIPFTVTDTFAMYDGRRSRSSLKGTAAYPEFYTIDGLPIPLYKTDLNNSLQAMLDLAKEDKYWYSNSFPIKNFVLKKVVKPLVLNAFFEEKNGVLHPIATPKEET